MKHLKRYIILYLSTLITMATLDCFWLACIARDFYQNRIGALLEFHPVPAIVFYLIYTAGIIVFVSGRNIAVKWQIVPVYGALFGFFAYATYDLTNMATLRGWSWQIVIIDVAWGTFNTAFSATCGWFIARFF